MVVEPYYPVGIRGGKYKVIENGYYLTQLSSVQRDKISVRWLPMRILCKL